MSIISETIATKPSSDNIDYPTSDGRPMGETDLHRNVMIAAIESLKLHYADQQVYVSGNILLFYEPGNRRRHLSPDVLVVKGLEQRDRNHYLLWEEGLAPNVVVEVTSASTRKEDMDDKFALYRDQIGVAEYFLFDPRSEYLKPALQGYRLHAGEYRAIALKEGRLPSAELGLCLEQRGNQLRFYDPAVQRWLPTVEEARQQAEQERRQAEQERQQAEQERRQAEQERRQAEQERRQAEDRYRRAEAENLQLRQEIESLRKRMDG